MLLITKRGEYKKVFQYFWCLFFYQVWFVGHRWNLKGNIVFDITSLDLTLSFCIIYTQENKICFKENRKREIENLMHQTKSFNIFLGRSCFTNNATRWRCSKEKICDKEFCFEKKVKSEKLELLLHEKHSLLLWAKNCPLEEYV